MTDNPPIRQHQEPISDFRERVARHLGCLPSQAAEYTDEAVRHYLEEFLGLVARSGQVWDGVGEYDEALYQRRLAVARNEGEEAVFTAELRVNKAREALRTALRGAHKP